MLTNWKKTLQSWIPILLTLFTLGYHFCEESQGKRSADIAEARRRGADSVNRMNYRDNMDKRVRKIERKLKIEQED